MANNGIALTQGTSPSYGVVGGIPTIVIEGTQLKGLSTWDHIVAGYRRVTGSLFAPQSGGSTPDTRGMTPQPATAGQTLAPLLAIGLAAAAGYFIWKGAK